MTPTEFLHVGGMTPAGLHHGGGMTSAGLQHGDPGHVMPILPRAMTPHHSSLENIDQIPNLPADQVSSVLNEPGMENFANMGFDGHASPPTRGVLNDDVQYESPASVEGVSFDRCAALN